MLKTAKLISIFNIIILLGQILSPIPSMPQMANAMQAEVSLAELVLMLNDATPTEDQVDGDGDGLWDPVEAVIGTDPGEVDSDFDRLSDGEPRLQLRWVQ